MSDSPQATSRVEKRTTSLIKESGFLKDFTKKFLPHSAVPPEVYRLPKIHKEDISLRLTAYCITSLALWTGKMFDGIDQPSVERTKSLH